VPKPPYIAYYRIEKQGVYDVGLFINKKQHPDVYKNLGALIEPNQVEYCINAFTEFVKDQKKSNKTINKAIDGLSYSQEKYQLQQNLQWRELEQRIFELKRLHKEHENVEQQVMAWLQKLDSKQTSMQALIENEQQDKKEMTMQVEALAKSQQEIFTQLNEINEAKRLLNERLEFLASMKDEVMGQFELVNASNDQILNKINEQTELQHQIADKMTTIEETQQEVIDRVDGQEGIIDKIIHQIDHVRFVLFERTNYLEEKMEKVYQQAVNYIQKVKSNVIQPSTLEIMNSEEEDRKEA